MKRKWSFFIGGAILAGYLLLAYGAPSVAIVCGIGLAALLTARGVRLAHHDDAGRVLRMGDDLRQALTARGVRLA